MAGRRWGVLILLLLLMQSGCFLLDKQSSVHKPLEDGPTLPAVDSARACQAVADKLASQGNPELAIEKLLKAREFDPHIEVSPALARLYSQTRNDRLAQEEFTKALAAHPHDADLWNDLGYFHYQRGNWVEAEEALRKAVAADAKHIRAWMNLGLALGQQEKYPESMEAFEKAVRPAEARCNLAFVLSTQGKFEKARQLYLEALKLDPGLKLARLALVKLDRPASSAATRPPLGGSPLPLPPLPE